MFANLMSGVLGLVLIFNAVLFIPQIMMVVKHRSSYNVSMLTFFGFLVVHVIMFINGWMHQQLALILGSAFSFCLCLVLLICLWRYPNRAGQR